VLALVSGTVGALGHHAVSAGEDSGGPLSYGADLGRVFLDTDEPPPARPTGAPTDLTAAATAITPCIVGLTVTSRLATDTASAIVWDEAGLAVTNAHVLHDAVSVTATLADGRRVPADVVGTDDVHDVAVLQLQAVSGLSPVVLSTTPVVVGDRVLAAGSPHGLEGTVTAGVVSALDRTVDVPGSHLGSAVDSGSTLTGAIQTDASVNAGSSGGAVVNAAGELIAMTAAMSAPRAGTGSVGISFAIPVSRVATSVEEILTG
jgi:putative serine protease PepD